MAAILVRNGLLPGAARLLAQIRQRVVFPKNTDHRVPLAIAGPDRRGDSSHAQLHLKAFLFQNTGNFLAAAELLIPEFRKIPQRAVQLLQQRRERLSLLPCEFLQIHDSTSFCALVKHIPCCVHHTIVAIFSEIYIIYLCHNRNLWRFMTVIFIF